MRLSSVRVASLAAGCQGEVPPGHDSDPMGHDGHPVQRGLAIEEHDVSILQVALHNVSHPQVCSHSPSVPKPQMDFGPIRVADEIRARPLGDAYT